jgi:hypothetical protein
VTQGIIQGWGSAVGIGLVAEDLVAEDVSRGDCHC